MVTVRSGVAGASGDGIMMPITRPTTNRATATIGTIGLDILHPTRKYLNT